MKNKRKIRKGILLVEILLSVFCLSAYALDVFWGDGDGIIDKVHLNPLLLFVFGQLFLLPMLLMCSIREWMVGLGVFLLSIVLCLFAINFFLNQYQSSQTLSTFENLGSSPIYTKYDSVYFKNYVPKARFITHLQEQNEKQRILNEINSLGVRGPELEQQTTGEGRTILLGDSFLQSDEVPFEKTIGEQLSIILGDSNQIIQHGQPSWSPLLELNWLLRQWPVYQADRVVLFLYYNDFYPGNAVGDSGYTPYARFDTSGYPIGFDFSSIEEASKRTVWTHFWERLSYLQLWRRSKDWFNQYTLHQKIAASKIPELLKIPAPEFNERGQDLAQHSNLYISKVWGKLATLRDTSIWDQATHKRLALSEHYLELMHQWLLEREVELIITLIPSPWQFLDENVGSKAFYGLAQQQLPRGGLEQRLQAFCQKKQIPFCPLFPAFSEFDSTDSSALYFHYDGHWTPQGHRLAAETLAHFLSTVNSKTAEDE